MQFMRFENAEMGVRDVCMYVCMYVDGLIDRLSNRYQEIGSSIIYIYGSIDRTYPS